MDYNKMVSIKSQKGLGKLNNKRLLIKKKKTLMLSKFATVWFCLDSALLKLKGFTVHAMEITLLLSAVILFSVKRLTLHHSWFSIISSGVSCLSPTAPCGCFRGCFLFTLVVARGIVSSVTNNQSQDTNFIYNAKS